jgi:regulator of protease activity HflC (stomatin/prohibitin superfamily)
MADDSSPALAAIEPDAYRGVVRVLLMVSALGMLIAAAGGVELGSPPFLDVAVSLFLASGVLVGVMRGRATPPDRIEGIAQAKPVEAPPRATSDGAGVEADALDWAWLRLKALALVVAMAGALANAIVLGVPWASNPILLMSASAVIFTLVGAGLAATAARYLARVDPDRFREAAGLARGARVLAWVLLSGAVAASLAWFGFPGVARVLHLLILTLNSAVCVELMVEAFPWGAGVHFDTDLRVFSLLGSRANPLASILDAAQRQLGIDLRSSWALDVVRRSAEPLLVGTCLIGWLSTAFTVIRVEEQGLVERLGVSLDGPPLSPGLHVHWPWPIDRVLRFPVRRVQTLMIGHEGEEESGPEDVLWAQQHGTTPEYTLLLGDGRDLIAVDAALKFRISDPRSWYVHTQNPEDALRAIAYRAVMNATVGHTLEQTLSKNVAVLTSEMRARVQADADALALGVEVMGFTVGGMHPPVSVAADYQAVVSAELARTTAGIAAKAYHNEIVPAAEAEATAKENAARAEGAANRARASGEAWGFHTLESQYRPAPDEFRFRRRLETLEKDLAGRRFTVLDARIQRDGGELWLVK